MTCWQAQQAYFSWLLRNDPLAFVILDPVVTVHPDQVFFEVFSKDEGAYAKLGIDRDAFDLDAELACGTTNIDFSQALFDGIQQMRSYRETRLSHRPGGGEAGHRHRRRGAGKAASACPTRGCAASCRCSRRPPCRATPSRSQPIDLYNLLRHLRLHGDRKGQRRGLRIELVPGERPRLVLEPWETVLRDDGRAVQGTTAARGARLGPPAAAAAAATAAVRRTGRCPRAGQRPAELLGAAGRRRDAHPRPDRLHRRQLVAGRQLRPAAAAQDPRRTRRSKPSFDHLQKVWFATGPDLAKATGLKGAALTEALQAGCQQGKLMYDLAADVYRLRPLTEAPLDLVRLEYRNQRERVAHDLLVRRGAVQIVTENRIPGTGLELTGKVAVAEDRREYRPQMLLADEGQVSRRRNAPAPPSASRASRPGRASTWSRCGWPTPSRRRSGLRAPTRGRRVPSRRGPTAGATRPARTWSRCRWSGSGSRCAGAGPASRCGCRRCVQHRGRGAGGLLRPDRRAGRAAASSTQRRADYMTRARGPRRPLADHRPGRRRQRLRPRPADRARLPRRPPRNRRDVRPRAGGLQEVLKAEAEERQKLRREAWQAYRKPTTSSTSARASSGTTRPAPTSGTCRTPRSAPPRTSCRRSTRRSNWPRLWA